jgi:predicted dehydrogenase
MSAKTSSDRAYRVGAIGCGRKGTEHARAYTLNPRAEVVAAADPDPENLELFCARFDVPGYLDYRDLLLKESIDIVSAILPVGVNAPVVIDCARADVPAICSEKPMAARLSDADRMVEACRRRGIKLGCGDLERNHPFYWDAKAIIDAGEIGPLRSISFFQGSGSQLSGGGCQIFSLIRLFASDADVDWISGWVTDDPWSEYDQGGAGYIRFVNGIEAFLHRRPTARYGFELLGERGIIYFDGLFLHLSTSAATDPRPTWTRLDQVDGAFSRTESIHHNFGTIDEEGWEHPGGRQLGTVQSMIDALDEDIEPRSNGDNGRRVLEMAIAIRQSHRRGHAPVELPLQDRDLQLIPVPSRMYSKKDVMGRHDYAREIGRYTQESRTGHS